ncbi:predicted protein [Nematostella vectensis]|uniref:Uncharacterized protein n=1 Tax=Nematostella vectensis TaxID=45351 RepID=A7SHI3_NEMVE|nr:uncharacterized protein LOC5508298 [Nematostella vectensis]EDO36847.1 predicted protein [Nematostella vectensis]|eukprot:XP_001628910.1 predicted protein [Nematostella vectensis]
MDEFEISRQRSGTGLIAMLKRKFAVLISFAVASVIVLHLLSNNHEPYDRTRVQHVIIKTRHHNNIRGAIYRFDRDELRQDKPGDYEGEIGHPVVMGDQRHLEKRMSLMMAPQADTTGSPGGAEHENEKLFPLADAPGEATGGLKSEHNSLEIPSVNVTKYEGTHETTGNLNAEEKYHKNNENVLDASELTEREQKQTENDQLEDKTTQTTETPQKPKQHDVAETNVNTRRRKKENARFKDEATGSSRKQSSDDDVYNTGYPGKDKFESWSEDDSDVTDESDDAISGPGTQKTTPNGKQYKAQYKDDDEHVRRKRTVQKSKSHSHHNERAKNVKQSSKPRGQAVAGRQIESCSNNNLGISSEANVSLDEQITCLPYQWSEKECQVPRKYFGTYDLHSKPPSCSNKPSPEICTITTTYRFSAEDDVSFECDQDSCGDRKVLLGCRDKDYGTVPDKRDWSIFQTVEDLAEELPRLVKQNSKLGFNFCFLKCSGDENEQALIFPPILKHYRKASRDSKINVNILLEDAISRPHFYRSLPQTVEALHEVERNSVAKLLDFEIFQSVASYTFQNLRILFAGKELLKAGTDNAHRDNGMDRFFNRFRSNGYQSFVQEDLCFFDTWGSAASPTYKDKVKPFTDEFKAYMGAYKNATERYTDNGGLTHFACESLISLGFTNPFKNLPKVCCNGRFTSEYLMDYIAQFLESVERDKKAAPAVMYTHLNSAHESSGKRIRSDDKPLAKLVRRMANLENTLTILLSDHGSKTMSYAYETFQGQIETFSPFMFIIVPEAVAKKLGSEKLKNLISNQKRLVGILDLHELLLGVLHPSHDRPASGLLGKIPRNRTCAEIVGLSSEAYCRCRGWNHFIDPRSQTVRWLAEIALGEINNRISAQYMNGSDSRREGYGSCARFVGKSVERARQQFSGNYIFTTLNLVLKPAWGVANDERFEVRLSHSSIARSHNVEVVSITRISRYGLYEACVDKSVDVRLCACASKKSKKRVGRPDIAQLMRAKHFGIQTEVRNLNSKCLIFGVRKFKSRAMKKMQTRVLGYEIANSCKRTAFVVKLGGTSRKSQISRKLPFTFRVQPRTISFLYSVKNAWRYGSFRPLVMLTRE